MNWPFYSVGARNKWTRIEAEGFSRPVPGCVYEGSRLDGGIPIGGLGTGYFTLEGSGETGYCSIYNDIVPPRKEFTDWFVIKSKSVQEPLSTASITYWGHFPVADLIADFSELSVSVGIRAWNPFIVGDARISNTPCGLFEIMVVNRGESRLALEICLSMPAPPKGKSAKAVLTGEGLTGEDENTGKAKIQVKLPAKESRRIRFAFAWYMPHWRDSSGEAHVHFYGTRYDSAAQIAGEMLSRYDELLKKVLGWQSVIYNTDYPDWMKDGLIQGFYSMVKNTVWIAKTRHDEWWDKENGWFTHNESHTGCPITETMVCRMHGHFPILLFFPELEVTVLDAFRHFQISDGEVPFTFGIDTSMRDPKFHCQHPLNSGQYAQMIYRFYKRTGSKEILERFYKSAKKAIQYQQSLDDDADGLINEQAHTAPGEFWPANQFYDIWPWWGTSAYVAGTWLATLGIGAAMAAEMEDAQFETECRSMMEKGLKAYNEKLWTGSYYRLWNDPENGCLSDVSLGNQLMGEWCLRVVGERSVLPVERIQMALDSIFKLNMEATGYGIINGVTPEGKRFDAGYTGENDHGKHIFFGESLCTAMTFMYNGHLETGMEIAKRLYEAVAIKSCSPWNQRCLVDGETGLPVWGDDYYSNMVIWAIPMAMEGIGIDSFTCPGGLVDRMIHVGGKMCQLNIK